MSVRKWKRAKEQEIAKLFFVAGLAAEVELSEHGGAHSIVLTLNGQSVRLSCSYGSMEVSLPADLAAEEPREGADAI